MVYEKVLHCNDERISLKLLMILIALIWVVYELQHTLDEITYMSVKWGRLYEIWQISRALMNTRRAHGQEAQNRENSKKQWG